MGPKAIMLTACVLALGVAAIFVTSQQSDAERFCDLTMRQSGFTAFAMPGSDVWKVGLRACTEKIEKSPTWPSVARDLKARGAL